MLDSAASCRVFYTVCKAIVDKLGHMFEFKSDMNRIVVGFGWISLPNCCGVLGFDRFQIDGKILDRKRFLHQSRLFSGVEESRELLNGPCFELGDGNSIPQYILGESCFPLLPWLLTPYVDHRNGLNSSEWAFNSVHRQGMELVGMAFGRVRARWKLLSKNWKEECIEAFPFVIVTCCLLHNFLIKCSEAMPDVNVEYYSREQELPPFEGEVDENGRRTRDALALHLNRFVDGGEVYQCMADLSGKYGGLHNNLGALGCDWGLCMYPGGARGQTTTPLGLLIGHGGDAPDGIVTHQVLEHL
ncbi:hypothetical protein Acr_00g0041720 [Actinidia rufa]|uniref:DDE Tnp4 domain-containing protein n=1 Tax=Actinidia rufa TaxID=165716 RepID=A0A7J0DJ78_9ERIC|nr:hypothetical protein Acr_00g0041720 [Actinidia rufa]